MPKYFQRKNLTAIIASTVKENVRKISERCDHELQVNFAQAISKMKHTIALLDAALISDLTSKGAIKVQSPGSNRLPLPISLHRGEEDALLLAIKSWGSRCLPQMTARRSRPQGSLKSRLSSVPR